MRFIQHSSPRCSPRRDEIAITLLACCATILLGSCEPPGQTTSTGGSNQYAYGTKISFAKSGRGAAHQVSGWSSPEPQFTWTEGETAVIAVRVPATDTAVALKVRASGFLNPPELATQPVEVFVNDRKIADWQVGQLAEHSAMIPTEMVKDGGLLTITFKMSKATSPKAAGVSEDPRVLGICVHEVELRKVG